MKRKLFLLLLLALTVTGSAKAADIDGWGIELTPTVSNSYTASAGSADYTTILSGSQLGVYTPASDLTDTIYWALPTPTPGVIVGKLSLRYKTVIAALDAAPDCSLYHIKYNTAGRGTTVTETTVALTEGSGCLATKDIHHFCELTPSAPVRVNRGDRLNLSCAINKSATSRTAIFGIGVYSMGR